MNRLRYGGVIGNFEPHDGINALVQKLRILNHRLREGLFRGAVHVLDGKNGVRAARVHLSICTHRTLFS
jgi:hypothetical protein